MPTKCSGKIYSNESYTPSTNQTVVPSGSSLDFPLDVCVTTAGQVELQLNISLLFENLIGQSSQSADTTDQLTATYNITRKNYSVTNGEQYFINLPVTYAIVGLHPLQVFDVVILDSNVQPGLYTYTATIYNKGTVDLALDNYNFSAETGTQINCVNINGCICKSNTAKTFYANQLFTPIGKISAIIHNNSDDNSIRLPLNTYVQAPGQVQCELNLTFTIYTGSNGTFDLRYDIQRDGQSIVAGEQYLMRVIIPAPGFDTNVEFNTDIVLIDTTALPGSHTYTAVITNYGDDTIGSINIDNYSFIVTSGTSGITDIVTKTRCKKITTPTYTQTFWANQLFTPSNIYTILPTGQPSSPPPRLANLKTIDPTGTGITVDVSTLYQVDGVDLTQLLPYQLLLNYLSNIIESDPELEGTVTPTEISNAQSLVMAICVYQMISIMVAYTNGVITEVHNRIYNFGGTYNLNLALSDITSAYQLLNGGASIQNGTTAVQITDLPTLIYNLYTQYQSSVATLQGLVNSTSGFLDYPNAEYEVFAYYNGVKQPAIAILNVLSGLLYNSTTTTVNGQTVHTDHNQATYLLNIISTMLDGKSVITNIHNAVPITSPYTAFGSSEDENGIVNEILSYAQKNHAKITSLTTSIDATNLQNAHNEIVILLGNMYYLASNLVTINTDLDIENGIILNNQTTDASNFFNVDPGVSYVQPTFTLNLEVYVAEANQVQIEFNTNIRIDEVGAYDSLYEIFKDSDTLTGSQIFISGEGSTTDTIERNFDITIIDTDVTVGYHTYTITITNTGFIDIKFDNYSFIATTSIPSNTCSK